MICTFACLQCAHANTDLQCVYRYTAHEYIKRTREAGRREQSHRHISLKFNLLCHCLTNCSTYSKHSSQQLGSKWGLHTPYKILHPMLNIFKISGFCYCLSPSPSPDSLLHGINLSSFFFFFFQNTHHNKHWHKGKIFNWYIILPMIMSHISTTKQTICESLMSVFCEAMESTEML